MDLSPATLAAVKLGLLFALVILLQRLRVTQWATILVSGGCAALFGGLYPPAWPKLLFGVLRHPDFLFLCLMVYLILLLASVQEASGQNDKLVRGMEQYLRSPRLRLVFFPALIGLFPMPGGALFSCPMVRATAGGMHLRGTQKVLVNYWFRHIWETAWPLYPGYALVCSLLGISVNVLWRYTFPLVFLSFVVGWYCFMRDVSCSPVNRKTPGPGGADVPAGEEGLPLPSGAGAESSPTESSVAEKAVAESDAGESASPGDLFLYGLPLLATLLGAAVFGLFFDRFLPEIPSQVAFCLSLLTGVGIALLQGRKSLSSPLRKLACNADIVRLLLLLLAIYLFKDALAAGGLIQAIGQEGDSDPAVLFTVVFVPLVCGLLTGILVGLVGLSFPLLLGILEHSPLREHLLPLAVLALICGNCGQMLSPVHVCLIVTCDFFSTTLAEVWRSLVLPCCLYALAGLAWAAALYASGVHF